MRRTMEKLKKLDSRGFTLIEVLISMVITIIVMGAVFGLLTRGQRSFQREPQVADLQQSARSALDMISKDVLQAGAGLPPEFPAFTTQAIDPTVGDGGGTTPDVIEIVGSSQVAGEMYFNPEPFIAYDGSSIVTMGLAPASLEVGDLVAVYDNDGLNSDWILAFVTAIDQTPPNAQVTIGATDGTVTIPAQYTTANASTITTGLVSRVSLVRYFTQLMGNDLILMRQVEFGTPMPVGMVDDFQVVYLAGTQPQVETVNPPDPHPADGVPLNPVDIVSGVRITVAARSADENLEGASDPDGPGGEGAFIRKTFSSNISPRNILAGCAERTLGLCSN